jgi:UDP-N-acetylglucosamine transferase subunit ALG13
VEKTKTELMLIVMQQRMSELVGAYEIQIASLRADITQLMSINDATTISASDKKK